MTFFGFLLEGSTIKPDPAKSSAIAELSPPRTKTEVRAFLGIVGYYRQFIFRFAAIAKPLSCLLHDNCPWEWSASAQKAFEVLKEQL